MQFLTETSEAKAFSEDLIRLIREQCHVSSRILIATQEPTIAPALMEFCDVTIVHRFRLPAWFDAIKGHLAGMAWSGDAASAAGQAVLDTIVRLEAGEALLFCPPAVLDVRISKSIIAGQDSDGDSDSEGINMSESSTIKNDGAAVEQPQDSSDQDTVGL